jgi:outer membrane protein assembly factor BamD
MRKAIGCLAFAALFLLTACKGEYERIRTSGDVKLITNKAFEYYNKKQYLRSQGLFDLVLSSLKPTEKGEEAYFKYAYTYYHQEQFTLSAYYFKNFANNYTNSVFREEAAFMSAYSNYLQSPSYRLEQSSTISAIEEFQLFVNLFPESRRVEECNKLIDEMRRKLEQKAFAEGELYFNLRQYQSAVISFDNLLKDYPETPDAERVLYLIAKSDYLLSNNSIVEKKEDRYTETITRCNDFLEKYSSGQYTKEIQGIKQSSEEKLRDVRKLLKKVPATAASRT